MTIPVLSKKLISGFPRSGSGAAGTPEAGVLARCRIDARSVLGPAANRPESVQYPVDPMPARSASAFDDPLALRPSPSRPCDCHGPNRANRTDPVPRRPASGPPSPLRSILHRLTARRRLRWGGIVENHDQVLVLIQPRNPSMTGSHPHAASSPSAA